MPGWETWVLQAYCRIIVQACIVECIMARKTSLPKSLSCTQIKKQWGITSLRTEQDPERELMKRIPLQEINFVGQNLERDLAGGRKRKLPNETTSSYTSKSIGEPPIDQVRLSKLEKDLKKVRPSRYFFWPFSLAGNHYMVEKNFQ